MDQNLTFEQLPNAVKTLTFEVRELKRLLLERHDQSPKIQLDKPLSVEEAAIFLNLAPATIYSKVSKGELPVMKRSKRLYFSQSELLEYLKKGKNKSATEIEEEAANFLKTKRRK